MKKIAHSKLFQEIWEIFGEIPHFFVFYKFEGVPQSSHLRCLYQLMADGQTGPTGRSVSAGKKELRVVSDIATTLNLIMMGKIVLEGILIHANANMFLVSKNTRESFEDNTIYQKDNK